MYFTKNWNYLLLLFVSYILESLSQVGISWFIAMVFAAVEKASMTAVLDLAGWGAGAIIFFFLANYFQKFANRLFLKKADTQLRQDVFHSLFSQDMDAFNSKNSAEYISVMNNDLGKIETEYLYKIPYAIETLTLSVISCAFLFFYSVEMALAIIVTAFIPMLIPLVFGKKVSESTEQYTQSMAGYNVSIKDIFTGYEVIKSFHADRQIEKMHANKLEAEEKAKDRFRAVSWLAYVMVYAGGYLLLVVQYVIATWLIVTGRGELALLMGALNLGNTVNNQFREAASTIVAIRGVEGLKKEVEKTLNLCGCTRTEEVPFEEATPITVRNLSFSYEKDGKEILKDVAVTFEKGKKYAVVGTSGSGKSTLLKLLMQYYEEYNGEILFGGREGRRVGKERLYEKIAMMHQKVFMFDDTLRNNITMYQEYGDEELNRAIERAGLSSVVAEKGLDALLGEGGNKLSGGEQQRVAIARAFLKKADILLFDEATASLDQETSAKIENTVLEQPDLTAIVITHKLDERMLRKYDSLVVVRKGRIAEMGTFEELMEQKQYFYNLYQCE